MFDRLIGFSLSQRLLILIATAVLIGAGIYALKGLPIDAFPDISSTQVKIIMKAPGMTPEEVETRIVAPIEQELLGIPFQTVLRSQSKYALADITIDFEDGTDVYWARNQVTERLSGVSKDLPPSVTGGLAPITTPLGEMFMFTIEGPQTLMEKRTVLETLVRPGLRSIAGVADVNSLGGQVKSFEVIPDVAALTARRISVSQLQTALEANNKNDGAGRLNSNEEALLVRSEGSVKTLGDVREIALLNRDGTTIRVGDVAQVRIGQLTRYGAVTKDGQAEAVEALVLGLRGANAQVVVEQVRARLTELEKTLPKGMSFKPFYDRGKLVGRAVTTVMKALAESIALVLILLFLFLGSLRAALVVALILPLSALGTFILMRYFHLSANLMSLGGLAIAIGMLVDAAVVVVENIEAHAADTKRSSASKLHQIYRAVCEVAVPVVAGIAIIIVVFLPLLTLQGLEGKLFTPVALTIVFALSVSLLLSLTVIPVLASFLLANQHGGAPWLVRMSEKAYRPILVSALRYPKLVIGAACLSLVIALVLFGVVGKSFMPALDEGDIIMQIEKLPSINLAQTIQYDLAVQKRILQSVPEVQSIVARSGSDELGLDPMGLNETDSFLVLKNQADWRSPNKDDLVDAIRKVISEFPGANFSFTQPIEMRTSEMLSGVRGDLAVKVFGSDNKVLGGLAEQIAKLLEKIPGSQDVLTVKNEGVQYLVIDVDRKAVGRFGLSIEQVQSDLRTLVEGRVIGVVLEDGKRLPLLVRGDDELQKSPALFSQLRLPLSEGQSIAVSDIAQLRLVDGPVKIDRENSSRMVVIRSNVRERDLVGFVEQAKAEVTKNITLPSGYRIAWGGQFENQQRASARLLVVVPVALVLVFLLLFSSLGTVRQALLVFVNIPFALVGGVMALAVTHEFLSVPASVGFIALMGIAVLNGLVLITHFNQLVAKGVAIEQLIVEGAIRRLRPVLMTASITAFGLIPLLLSTGPGSEVQRPLAIVVIGGLVSSTILTLVLVPVLFRRFGLAKA